MSTKSPTEYSRIQLELQVARGVHAIQGNIKMGTKGGQYDPVSPENYTHLLILKDKFHSNWDWTIEPTKWFCYNLSNSDVIR